MEFIEEFARQENCKVIALSSGFERKNAHRFYEERMNYQKRAYAFKKSLQ
ncbi:GNAT family protein [Mastigocoleus testarum]